jgi:hypothetical protein
MASLSFFMINIFFCQEHIITSLLDNQYTLPNILLFVMASSGRNTRASTRNDGRFSLQVQSRRSNSKAIIDNPLGMNAKGTETHAKKYS